MAKRTLEEVVENIDSRLTRVEQILPTLATKDDLKAYATREDLRAESRETRRHFDVVAERLEGQIQLLAEGQVALQEQMGRGLANVASQIEHLDRRVMRLEAAPRR